MPIWNRIFTKNRIIAGLAIALVLLSVFYTVPGVFTKTADIIKSELTLGGIAQAAGVADATCDGAADDIQAQALVTALPATGGRVYILTGTYVWSNATTVTRAIDNVTVEGTGAGTYLTGDTVTAQFTAGGNGWTFKNLRVDVTRATLIAAMGATTNWSFENVTCSDGYIAYRNSYGSATYNDATVASLTDSGLTATRVPFAGAGGLLTDDADLTYDTGTDILGTPTGRATTYLVAASDAPTNVKAQADVVCDNTSDQTEINTALAGGGNVLLSAGTFTIDGAIIPTANSVLLGWSGDQTTIHLDETQILISNVSNVELGQFKVTGDVGDPGNQGTWEHAIKIYANGASISNFYIHDIECEAISNISDFAIYVNTGHTVSDVLYERDIADSPDGFGFIINGFNASSVIQNVTYYKCDSYNAGIAATRYLVGGESWVTGFDFCESAVAGCTVKNIHAIECLSDGAWESGFHCEYVPTYIDCSLVDCTSTNAGQKGAGTIDYGAGFWMTGQWTITNCYGHDNGLNGMTISYSVETIVIGGAYNDNTGEGLQIIDSSRCKAIGVTATGNTIDGLYVHSSGAAASTGNQIVNCTAHGNTQYQLKAGGTTNTTNTKFKDNYVEADGWGWYYDNATNTEWSGNSIIATGEIRSVFKAITAGIQNTVTSVQNSFGANVLITEAYVRISTAASASNPTYDMGTDDDGAGAPSVGNNLFEAIPDTVGYYRSTSNGLGGDASGVLIQPILWETAGGGNDWVNFIITDAAGADTAGRIYLTVMGR